ncbi:MAG: hypothetical protein AAF548_20190 [Actinomycetota bacterium]
MRRAPTRRFSAILIALAVVASACGDDGGSDATADGTAPPEAADDTAPPEAADGDGAGDDAPADDETVPQDTAPTTAAPEEERRASFRGVTEDVIRVGVIDYDWDTLAAAGVSLGNSNSVDLMEAAVQEINDRGGIYGRTLEIYAKEFLPVGATEADQVCVELTEDEEVFLVLGRLRDDQVLCFTETYETAAFTLRGMTESRLERSAAPYVTIAGVEEERIATIIGLMDDLGVLGDATIGVTGSAGANQSNFDAALAELRNLGYDPTDALSGETGDDVSESEREAELLYERLKQAGVDTAIATTGVANEIAVARSSGFEPDQWILTTMITGRALTDGGVPWEFLDGALSATITPVGTSAQPGLVDDPDTSACIDDLVSRSGHEVFYELDVEINDIGSALLACGLARIVENALLNAGVNPTNETLQAGIEAIGELELAGYGTATLSAGDYGAVDTPRLVRFDGATGVWNPVE